MVLPVILLVYDGNCAAESESNISIDADYIVLYVDTMIEAICGEFDPSFGPDVVQIPAL